MQIVDKAAVGILSKPIVSTQCCRLNFAATHWTKEAFHGMLQSVIDQIDVFQA
jgi:hypothetical protein